MGTVRLFGMAKHFLQTVFIRDHVQTEGGGEGCIQETMNSNKPNAIQELISSLEINRLVPEHYAAYRTLLSDALEVFLDRLPDGIQSAIALAQQSLAENAAAEVRLFTLFQSCPALQKLGQIVARHEKLDEPLKAQLRLLESSPISRDTHAVESLAIAALQSNVERYDIALCPNQAEEGSVAVVIPCSWRMPSEKRRRRGMIKVLKPGIKERVSIELEALRCVATHLDEHDHPNSKFEYRETLDTVRELLIQETDLEAEQRHLSAARKAYRRASRVKIPQILPFSSPAVTAMEQIMGAKVTDSAAAANPLSANVLAWNIVETLVLRVIFSKDKESIFHADPHAGNIFATPDGRVAPIDWSLVGYLSWPVRTQLTDIFLGGLTLDQKRITRAVNRLSTAGEDATPIDQEIRAALAKVKNGQLPGPTWIAELFDGLMDTGLRFSAELLLFRKSLFTITGVISEIAPRFSVDKTFFVSFFKYFSLDYPKRLYALPLSHNFRTHLSNYDLLRLYVQTPLVLARYLR